MKAFIRRFMRRYRINRYCGDGIAGALWWALRRPKREIYVQYGE